MLVISDPYFTVFYLQGLHIYYKLSNELSVKGILREGSGGAAAFCGGSL